MDLFTISDNKNIEVDNLSSVRTSTSNASSMPMTNELSNTSSDNRSLFRKTAVKSSDQNGTLSTKKTTVTKSTKNTPNTSRNTSTVKSVTLVSESSKNPSPRSQNKKSTFYGGSFDSSMAPAGVFLDDAIIKKLERVVGRTNDMMKGGYNNGSSSSSSSSTSTGTSSSTSIGSTKIATTSNYVPFDRNTTSLLKNETSPMYTQSNTSNYRRNDRTNNDQSLSTVNSGSNDDLEDSISDISSETESTITFGEDTITENRNNKKNNKKNNNQNNSWRYTTSSGWNSDKNWDSVNSENYSDYTNTYTESDFNRLPSNKSINSRSSRSSTRSKYNSSNNKNKSGPGSRSASSRTTKNIQNKKLPRVEIDNQKEYLTKHLKDANYLMSESDLFTATG